MWPARWSTPESPMPHGPDEWDGRVRSASTNPCVQSECRTAHPSRNRRREQVEAAVRRRQIPEPRPNPDCLEAGFRDTPHPNQPPRRLSGKPRHFIVRDHLLAGCVPDADQHRGNAGLIHGVDGGRNGQFGGWRRSLRPPPQRIEHRVGRMAQCRMLAPGIESSSSSCLPR